MSCKFQLHLDKRDKQEDNRSRVNSKCIVHQISKLLVSLKETEVISATAMAICMNIDIIYSSTGQKEVPHLAQRLYLGENQYILVVTN